MYDPEYDSFCFRFPLSKGWKCFQITKELDCMKKLYVYCMIKMFLLCRYRVVISDPSELEST